MRILTGKLRGRNITAPPGRNTRPTRGRTRESIFNILGHADWVLPLEGAIVADIFAGSGALGFEAVSRGAEFCLFVETDPKARAAIRDNMEKMNLFGCTRLHRRDAIKLRIDPYNLRGPFTHIFVDPPYSKNLWHPVIARLKSRNLIADKGTIILEVAKDEETDVDSYKVMDERIWGAAKVLFLQINGRNYCPPRKLPPGL
ncbi:MAG: 16S rRNA (guanine(966)-N(2))-methyltransferase RsmD [Hyphomonadaceae bacterium]|nr:16S rRNA (guanine(966)-N(2))-methyltransferase RsmD [Hyphomonadaceae bacterium]